MPVAIGKLEIPLAFGIVQVLDVVLDLGRQQTDAILTQHAKAHGERLAVEVLRHLALKAARCGDFDFVGYTHDFSETPLLRVCRCGGGLARQVLHEQHCSRLHNTGG
ncbi:hypothetical protein D3C81_1121850 [compost metagenome]